MGSMTLKYTDTSDKWLVEARKGGGGTSSVNGGVGHMVQLRVWWEDRRSVCVLC